MIKYIIAAIIVTLLFIANILKNKISKDALFILKTVLIVAFLEITVFNINSYRTDFGRQKYIEFSEKEIAEMTSLTTENTQYVVIDNINQKIKSVYLKLESLKENQVVDYDMFYADKSTSNRYLASKSYYDGVEKTKYSTISLSRKL